jgi:ubiquinone/menaquinone biosynthesis C-methylase UbiE
MRQKTGLESPDRPQISAAEANRRYYRDIAKNYEASERCVKDLRQRSRMQGLLQRALAAISATEPLALDACGGTGNVSMEMVRHGVVPVLVDISPEMTDIYAAKAKAGGLSPEFHVEPLAVFLARDERVWDLVVFSSALHHLENYLEVLELVRSRLALGGAVLTVFDPTPGTPLLRRLRRLDWAIGMLLRQPRKFARTFIRMVARDSGLWHRDDDYVGRRAERYALEGVDDLAIVASFPSAEFEVLEHERSHEAQLRLIRCDRTPVVGPPRVRVGG